MTNHEDMPEWQSVFRSSLFCNKVALVTGGGTGIGRIIALGELYIEYALKS